MTKGVEKGLEVWLEVRRSLSVPPDNKRFQTLNDSPTIPHGSPKTDTQPESTQVYP